MKLSLRKVKDGDDGLNMSIILQIFHCFVDCRNSLSNLYLLRLYKCSILFWIPYSIVALIKISSEAPLFIHSTQFHHLIQSEKHVRCSFGSILLSGSFFSMLYQKNSLPLLLKKWQHLQFSEAALSLLLGRIKGMVWSTAELHCAAVLSRRIFL